MTATAMLPLNAILQPGMIVCNPLEPGWGQGQIQSIAGNLVTVNFEHAGKLVIDGARVELEERTDFARLPSADSGG